MCLRKCIAAFCLLVGLAAARPSHADPRELGYGIWFETYKQTVIYVVDTQAQACFFSMVNAGSGLIDCEILARRAEWQPIIKWAQAKPVAPVRE